MTCVRWLLEQAHATPPHALSSDTWLLHAWPRHCRPDPPRSLPFFPLHSSLFHSHLMQVTFTIARGERLALVGQNGSGADLSSTNSTMLPVMLTTLAEVHLISVNGFGGRNQGL